MTLSPSRRAGLVVVGERALPAAGLPGQSYRPNPVWRWTPARLKIWREFVGNGEAVAVGIPTGGNRVSAKVPAWNQGEFSFNKSATAAVIEVRKTQGSQP